MIMKPFHVAGFILCALCVIERNYGYIWENYREIDNIGPYASLQRVPRQSITARRLLRFFIGYRHGYQHNTRAAPKARQNLVFLLDSSNSMGKGGFQRQVYAVRQIVRNCPINTRVAAISFSSRAYLGFGFTSAAKADEKLRRMEFKGNKKTNTQEALQLARELFLKARGIRPNDINKVMLITDGLSNVDQEMTLYRGFQLKAMGIQLYVIAMGRRVYGMPEVVGLVSSVKRHLFRVRDLAQFMRITWRIDMMRERR